MGYHPLTLAVIDEAGFNPTPASAKLQPCPAEVVAQ